MVAKSHGVNGQVLTPIIGSARREFNVEWRTQGPETRGPQPQKKRVRAGPGSERSKTEILRLVVKISELLLIPSVLPLALLFTRSGKSFSCGTPGNHARIRPEPAISLTTVPTLLARGTWTNLCRVTLAHTLLMPSANETTGRT